MDGGTCVAMELHIESRVVCYETSIHLPNHPHPHRILDCHILGLIEALALPCILEVKLSSINRIIFMRVHPAKLRVQV